MKLILKKQAVPVEHQPQAQPEKPNDAEALREAREYYREMKLDQKPVEKPEDRPFMTLLPGGGIKGDPEGKWEIVGKIQNEGTRG